MNYTKNSAVPPYILYGQPWKDCVSHHFTNGMLFYILGNESKDKVDHTQR